MQEIHNKKTKDFLEFHFKKNIRKISTEEVNGVQSQIHALLPQHRIFAADRTAAGSAQTHR